MSATMLAIVQQAAGEMSLAVPSTVAGNTASDPMQLLYLLNGLGQELQRRHQWQALSKAYIFTVSYTSITGDTTLGSSNLTNASSIVGLDSTYGLSGAGINQATYISGTPSGSTIALSQPATSSNVGATYSLTKMRYSMPTDYDQIIDDTQWDKSKHWMMVGPLTAQQWEYLVSGWISTGPRVNFRIFGNYFQIWPLLGTAEVLGFEYMSNAWAASAASVAQSSFIADTDTCIYPDRLMVVGLKKKYMETKGFDTQIIAGEYLDELDLAKAADAGSPKLSMAPRSAGVLIGWNQIPDTGYGPA